MMKRTKLATVHGDLYANGVPWTPHNLQREVRIVPKKEDPLGAYEGDKSLWRIVEPRSGYLLGYGPTKKESLKDFMEKRRKIGNERAKALIDEKIKELKA